MAGKLVIDESLEDPQEILGKVALRLIGERPGQGAPTLYIGALPDEFPMELPLLPDTDVLGTIIWSPEKARVLEQGSEAPQRVVEIFDNFMLAEGWRRRETGPGPGGFLPGSEGDFAMAQYCKTDSGPSLHISAQAWSDSVSEIGIAYEGEDHGLCRDPEIPRPMREPMREMQGIQSATPPLGAPAGTWKSGASRTGSPEYSRSSAILETEMTLEDIMDHYATQLDASEWVRVGAIRGQNTFVTYWEFVDSSDQPYSALLDVTQAESQPELRYLQLVANKLDPSQGGPSIWASTAPTFIG